ncbi:rho termination factor [Artemisia annua]|uniref:Rho termination factor n=1 Tax=Artemisia annua TaxID=35608 RepID=A0A2U1NIQ4_ARTAN|nr:rho termination factor [Artemisia annua]
MDDNVWDWDDDLWGPPNYQATEDTKYGIDGCTCAYCLSYDEEKESALNEQICIEVLNRLISQADTDMTELEEEIFELLIQLARTDKEFSDICGVHLNMKINILKSSIMKLKGNASNSLSTSREPAESKYETLKSLFDYYSQKKKQVLEANPSSEKKEMDSSSNVNQMGKRKRDIFTPLEEHTISQTIVKVKEENEDYPCTSLVPKHTASSLRVASTCDMNREVHKLQLKSPIMTHDNVHNPTDKSKFVCQKPSLETQGRWKHQLKTVKSQPDEESTGSTSIRLEESSREPNAKKTVNNELGSPVHNSKLENHQEPRGTLSLTVYSPNTYKRHERVNSLRQKSSSSPLLLEGPKQLCTHETDVDNPRDMESYTVGKLKAIAKSRGLTRYSSLRKSVLLELLGINVAEAKRKN